MAEKRDINPIVQDIFRVQSEPISLPTLIAIERADQIRFGQLHEEIVGLSNQAVAPTSFARRCEDELTMLGLISSPKNGFYELTDLGRESLGAFFEYRSRVLPAIIKSRLDSVEQHLGEAVRKELEEIIPPVGAFREEPALMRVMRVQSGHSAMRMLANLAESANQSITFTGLLTAILINDMEKEGLVRKPQSGKSNSIVLTSLGQVSVEAYFEYQEKLKPAIKVKEGIIIKRLTAELLMDLGITP